jgi:hypothetical protein
MGDNSLRHEAPAVSRGAPTVGGMRRQPPGQPSLHQRASSGPLPLPPHPSSASASLPIPAPPKVGGGCGLSPLRTIVQSVPKKPLALVTAVTVCDYLVWNWSSEGNSGIVSLITGLALAPLLLAFAWLLLLGLLRIFITRPTEGSQAPSVKARQIEERAAARAQALALARRTIARRPRVAIARRPRRPRVAGRARVATGQRQPTTRARAQLQGAERHLAAWQTRDRQRVGAAAERTSSDEIAA